MDARYVVLSTTDIVAEGTRRTRGLELKYESNSDPATRNLYSTGLLEFALELGLTVLMVTSRSTVCPQDHWWLEVMAKCPNHLRHRAFFSPDSMAWDKWALRPPRQGWSEGAEARQTLAWVQAWYHAGHTWPTNHECWHEMGITNFGSCDAEGHEGAPAGRYLMQSAGISKMTGGDILSHHELRKLRRQVDAVWKRIVADEEHTS